MGRGPASWHSGARPQGPRAGRRRSSSAGPPSLTPPLLPATLAVGVGGAIGATLRFAAGEVMGGGDGGFPQAIFTVNVVGSFVLGAVLVVLGRVGRLPFLLAPLIGTGLIGAFTTYSSFAVDTVVLIRDGEVVTALLYNLVTILAGLAAAALGLSTAAKALRGGSLRGRRDGP